VRVKQRKTDLAPFVTDNGNAILDCMLGPIADPEISDIVLRAIHGVVATGLFPASLTSAVLVADENGVRELARPNNVFPLQRG
jgi:ribose 5-phosphate isomerase